jgi:hypothetical protein
MISLLALIFLFLKLNIFIIIKIILRTIDLIIITLDKSYTIKQI